MCDVQAFDNFTKEDIFCISSSISSIGEGDEYGRNSKL